MQDFEVLSLLFEILDLVRVALESHIWYINFGSNMKLHYFRTAFGPQKETS